jgi:hypothetical protein
MRTEPGSELVILREDLAMLASKVETLQKELKIAVQYCRKEYWTDGHGGRVRDTYGIDADGER